MRKLLPLLLIVVMSSCSDSEPAVEPVVENKTEAPPIQKEPDRSHDPVPKATPPQTSPAVPSPTPAVTRPDPPGGDRRTAPELHVKPRYYRWHVDTGQEWVEKNTSYARLEWQIPLSQATLVLVDVWDRHYIKDPEVRAEKIIQERIRPLLAACRKAGLRIVHAPSSPQARESPAWVGRSDEDDAPAPTASRAGSAARWPPSKFRAKTGPYLKYARPVEPMEKVRAQRLVGKCIHPDVRPEGNEVVVATGDELHRYCRKEGILFLFYVGFNTNGCILTRDYGTLQMSKRGYEAILVRDCTTGMESFETTDQLLQTRGAILFLEMFGRYSVTSDELIAGLPVEP